MQTTFDELNGEISPDSRWVAYQSNESGQGEINVRPFPDTDSGRWEVSTGGGTRPLGAQRQGALLPGTEWRGDERLHRRWVHVSSRQSDAVVRGALLDGR